MSLRITLHCDGPGCLKNVEVDGADDMGSPAPQMTSGDTILIETGWITMPAGWTWRRAESGVRFYCARHRA